MYCGNNRRSSSLRNGTKVIGTRYKCFQAGIGVGLNLPYDKEYTAKHVPIQNLRVYCGNEKKLPVGYDVMGTLPMCMVKGVGVGKSIKAKKVQKSRRKSRRKSRSRRRSKR
jgi:hypothetical protein